MSCDDGHFFTPFDCIHFKKGGSFSLLLTGYGLPLSLVSSVLAMMSSGFWTPASRVKEAVNCGKSEVVSDKS